MKTIVVPGINIEIPVGFGCSSLASVGKKQAFQLLGAAFEAGVRHFDVARYYGYGEAESLLGQFIKTRRAEVTITTKFGIDPPRRTNALQFAMKAGRQLVRIFPAARRVLSRKAQGLVKTGGFTVQEARTSLETSLRELGTDYIDFFLLHDYEPTEASTDDLVAFLKDRVAAGTIRHFGIGTSIEGVLSTSRHSPELCAVTQFKDSVLCRNMEKLSESGTRSLLVITHGSLASSYQVVANFLRVQVATARDWSNRIGLDCSREETISGLMLNYAVHANAHGLVLFSSRNPLRTKRNIEAVSLPGISVAQVELFGELVLRDMMRSSQIA